MSDLGHEQTDKELKKIENIISKEYKQASQEIEDKMLKHFEDFNAKDIVMRKKVESGQITESQYNQWRIGQMATGERWISLRDSLTSTLVNADKVATQIIQGNSIKAYGDNMNYGTYEIEHGSKINTGFVLYDSNTVINLMKDDPKIIPMPRLDIPKDEQWNRQHLSSAVLQGILQGESIPKIADRLQNVAFMGRNSAIRNARTYTTAAENKGRIDSYERAEKMGIKTNKKWIATLDDRTRAEHRHLDGMSVPPDEKFETDGYIIGFPGDPSAEPEMFYNCRCTLVADIVGYPYNDERNDSKLGDMTYEEWKHAKDKPTPEFEKTQISKEDVENSIPKNVREKLDKLEDKYFDAKTEHYFAIDKDGNLIFESGKGGSRNVSVPKSVDERMEGGFSYHNHTADAIFSVSDISNYEKYGEHGFITTPDGTEYILYNMNPVSKYEEVEKASNDYDDEKYKELMPFSVAAGTEYKNYDEQYWQDRREYSKELMASEPDSSKRAELLNEWMKDHPSTDEHMRDWLKENSEEYGFVFIENKNGEESQTETKEEIKSESETKSEQKEWIKHIEFTPAETIEEAEQYAKDNFIQSGGFYNLTGKTISYKGIDLDMANRINERLTDIYGNFDVGKLSSLESYGKSNKKAYKDHEQAGMLTTNFGNIGINREICGSQKLMDKYNADAERDFQFVMDNIDSLTGAKRALAETYKEAGRSLVGDQIEDFITHEMGHHISYMADVNKELSDISRQGNWKNYARSLSGYANATFGEYIAESFNAYYRGETDALQPEIIDIFERLRKE